jgi:4-amino-4-deoxy-L-arabinose transferase-like glycosyltransferase
MRAADRDALLLLALALLIRLLGAALAPLQFDELYHLLAARSWLADGSVSIGDGAYTRTRLYTVLVACGMKLFGDSPFGARMPAVLAGALLVPAVFLVVRRQGGVLAAWAAALLVCCASYAIGIAQFARFYALHALLFWIGAALLFDLVTGERRGWLWRGALAGVALLGALYLQITTAIGLLALFGWAIAALGVRHVDRLRRFSLGTLIGGAVLLLLLAGFAGFLLWDQIRGFIHDFRGVSLWAAHRRGDIAFYHHWFGDQMALLWFLFPVAAALAFLRNRAFTLFCLSIVLVGFGLFSLAGMKSDRYVFYLFPFMMALWGLAIATLAPAVWAVANRIAEHRLIAGAVIGICLLAALAGNAMFVDTGKQLAREAVLLKRDPAALAATPDPPWPEQRAALARALPRGTVLVTTDELRTLYYLGHYQLLLNRSRLDEVPGRREFAPDPRTGRPVIGTLAALRRLVECRADGAVLVAPEQWAEGPALGEDVRAYLATSMQPSALGEMRLFRWRTPAPGSAASCQGVTGAVPFTG